MKGMFVKDMEIMRGNMKTFIGVYIIAIFCFLSTSAGPSFLISYVSVLAAVIGIRPDRLSQRRQIIPVLQKLFLKQLHN